MIMKKIINYQRMIIVAFIMFFMSGIYYSYAFFLNTTASYRATEIMVSKLLYMIDIEGISSSNNTIKLLILFLFFPYPYSYPYPKRSLILI